MLNNYIYNDFDIQIANKSSRASGAVGSNPFLPKIVASILNKTIDKKLSVLDFGAGKTNKEGKLPTIDWLKTTGHFISAYDFGKNVNPEIHDVDALSKKYDIVYASNVLNVQNNIHMLEYTLNIIKPLINEDGYFLANYPKEPRYMTPFNNNEMAALLKKYFLNVEVISKSPCVFVCSTGTNQSLPL